MTFSFFSFFFLIIIWKISQKGKILQTFCWNTLKTWKKFCFFLFFSFSGKIGPFFFFFGKIGPKRSNCKHAGNKGNLISLWNYVESRISLSFWAYLEQPSRNWSESLPRAYKIVGANFENIDFFQTFDKQNFWFYFKSELLMFWRFFWGAACLSSSKIGREINDKVESFLFTLLWPLHGLEIGSAFLTFPAPGPLLDHFWTPRAHWAHAWHAWHAQFLKKEKKVRPSLQRQILPL